MRGIILYELCVMVHTKKEDPENSESSFNLLFIKSGFLSYKKRRL